jgi:hypothetical protein
MLFNFVLRPLGDVAPWGKDPPKLHWFGLTDGWFWLEADDQTLFRFSDTFLEQRCGQGSTAPVPYVDYYVVRLWEDVLDGLHDFLSQVPLAVV